MSSHLATKDGLGWHVGGGKEDGVKTLDSKDSTID